MVKKTPPRKKPTTPVRLMNEEILIRFKSPEERKKIEEQKVIEEKRKAQELAQSEKQKKLLSFLKRAFLFLFILMVGSFLNLVIRYIYPKNSAVVTSTPPNIRLAFTSPKYLAVDDENIVEFTLENLDASNSFSGTVTLVITDSLNSVVSASGRTMSVQIKDLLPNDRFTGQYKIKLSKDPAEHPIKFQFQIALPDNTLHVADGGEFLLSPIQRVRSIWIWITGGSGVVALILNLLFDQLKTLMGVKSK